MERNEKWLTTNRKENTPRKDGESEKYQGEGSLEEEKRSQCK